MSKPLLTPSEGHSLVVIFSSKSTTAKLSSVIISTSSELETGSSGTLECDGKRRSGAEKWSQDR